nr:RNA-directed DNA polymerase, eukaryota, reverse transcriptase zinc-binding domain protein [Tanacetum cinerariifolium]
LKYPPGFTPIDRNGENSTPAEDGMIRNVEEVRTGNREENNDAFSDIRVNSYTKEVGTESLSSGHFKKSELPRTGGSILGLLDEEWSKTSTVCRKNVKAQYKRELQAVDLIIDSGQGTEKEISTLEGDENYGFFHGMLNKKRSILNIQGVMVDGMWVDSPNKVKKEFLDHFNNQFYKPDERKATLQMEFPKQIHSDQQRELESEVSNDEIKKAVWECGTDKSPGPDGFTFGGIFNELNEVQSAFIADRQMLDGPFILNEVFQWCKRKKQTLIFKVDFEKAYDSVRWDFLDDVLRKFGFGEKWRKWIQCCLQSSRGSIIINGSLTKEFQFGKGPKQGDPLSLFLFILIMKSLHLSFQRVVDAGMFHVHVLECFHRVSGLKINMSKSKILGVHVDNVKVSRAANKLGCLVLKTSFLYLGSFVGGAMHRLQAWNDIVDRVRRRLSKWKMKMLSIEGRLTLVKSVLARRLHGFNGIRFLTQDTSLWARVIKAIHGGDGNIGAGMRSGTKSCWMNIVNEINVLSKKDINLMNFLRIKLGNGESTLFWEDFWCEGGKLKDRFCRAYALESCKTIIVESKLVQPNLTYSFRRTPRGGAEQTKIDELAVLMQLFTLAPISDRWTWTLNSSDSTFRDAILTMIPSRA